jgi:hypothetical protein
MISISYYTYIGLINETNSQKTFTNAVQIWVSSFFFHLRISIIACFVLFMCLSMFRLSLSLFLSVHKRARERK